MNLLKYFVVGLFLIALSIIQTPAQVIFSDGFESYTAGVSPLDMNTAGPNASPNGGPGNPWFGPAPPNAHVVGTDSINGPTVSPHSGNNMIRGRQASDFDENWVNLAYRFNGGNPYTGNIQYDWWFYDPLGPGGSTFRDYAALGYYNTAPSATDYPGTGSLNGSTLIQRLSLGASNPSGFDANKYQARIVGATDGINAAGWFNLSLTRSIGWHEGRIVVDNANNVSFYIDDMVNPLLTHSAVLTYGYNVIEVNTFYGTTTGYFDDVSFSVIPEPSTAALLLCGGLSSLALRRRKVIQ